MIDWNAVTAVATLLAVLVALFQEPFRRWKNSPRLGITWRERDSNREELANGVLTYVRLHVINTGREAARRVEVIITDVYRRHSDGSYQLEAAFLPTALKWTHSEAPRCEELPPGAARLCNLGAYLYSDANDKTIRKFYLATEIEPENDYNVLDTGVFAIRIVVSSVNAPAVTLLTVLAVGIHAHTAAPDVIATFSISVASSDIEKRIAATDKGL